MPWRRTLVILSALLCLIFSLSASADQLDHWVWRQPQPFSLQVNAVAHGNGLWALFANSGMVATSPDGIEWDLANAATNALFINAAFGNGRFVATSSRGVLYSMDGHSWFPAAGSGSIRNVAFGNGLFFGADGIHLNIWRSTDGSNWTSQALGGLSHFNTASFANNRYFMIGTDYTYRNYLLYTSTDATNWTGPVALGTNNILKIVYGNGVYVGINNVSTLTTSWSEFRTSTDGTTWSDPTAVTNTLVNDIVFANGQFVALDAGGQVFLSPDGTNWSTHAVPDLFAAFTLGWNDGQFLASGVFG
ncbi:MAG TPA: hypothetical protein VKA67_05170, partial [Verrucomicrobiae bacterium]|nr:hypothetical protein [Verrucomicrobiae bacterium]